MNNNKDQIFSAEKVLTKEKELKKTSGKRPGEDGRPDG